MPAVIGLLSALKKAEKVARGRTGGARGFRTRGTFHTENDPPPSHTRIAAARTGRELVFGRSPVWKTTPFEERASGLARSKNPYVSTPVYWTSVGHEFG